MSDSAHDPNTGKASRTVERLKPIDRSQELLPWRRAQELTRCLLYWIPVSSFPIPVTQRVWLFQFFDRFSELVKAQAGLREEVFFQFKEFYELRDSFLAHQQEFMPMCGLSRRPGAALPVPPSFEEITAMGKAVLATDRPPDAKQFMPDYCYWFAKKSAKKQRELFFGHGALTTIFLKPDPKSAPPELPPQMKFLKKIAAVQQFDLEAMMATAFSLKDPFLAQSKQLFGDDVKDNPQARGVMYILPLLTSADFFSQPDAEAEKWFQLFDVYIHESPADQGVLMAFKNDFEELLIGLLEAMKNEGLIYRER